MLNRKADIGMLRAGYMKLKGDISQVQKMIMAKDLEVVI